MYIGRKSELKTHWVAFRACQAHPRTLPTCLLHDTAALHQPVLASGLDVGQATNMVGWYGGSVYPQHWHHELQEWAGGSSEGEGEGEGAFLLFCDSPSPREVSSLETGSRRGLCSNVTHTSESTHMETTHITKGHPGHLSPHVCVGGRAWRVWALPHSLVCASGM